MGKLKVLIARFRALLDRDGVIRDIEEEFRSHVDIETDTHIERGMAPDQARRVALERFGNSTLIKDAAYEVRGGGLTESIWCDVRFGFRMLVKNPGFSIVAIVTLALGIGANSAIFSIVNSVLMRPLPFQNEDTLVAIWRTSTLTGESQGRGSSPGTKGSFSYPDFLDFRSEDSLFERLAIFRTGAFTITGRGEATRAPAAVVSASLFGLLGVTPLLGRDFEPQDDSPENGLKVILSHRMWQDLFGSDPGVLGQTLVLTNRSYSIIGVMPPGFQFPISADPPELWATIAADAQRTSSGPSSTEQRGNDYLNAIGRLRPNTNIAQAQAEMSMIASRLEAQHPEEDTGSGVRLVPAHEDLIGDVRPALLVLLASVGAVLLIACANITSLQLARATTRNREIAIRSALGAGRVRIIRQLLTEGVVLATGAGVIGLILGVAGTGLLLRLSPRDIPRLQESEVDLRVLAFTVVLSLLTGIVFGIAPALQVSRADLARSLKEGGRGATGGRRRSRMRSVLVVAQVAVGFVLLAGAGLLLQTLWHLARIDPGFNVRNVFTFRISLPSIRYSAPRQIEFYDRLTDRIRSIPGVRSASAVFPLPLTNNDIEVSFEIEGRTFGKGQNPVTQFRWAAPDYFSTMGIPLVKGRDFGAADDQNSRPVVIVNETLARRFFHGEDPIGKEIKPGISQDGTPPPWRQIIGLVGDVRHASLTREADPEVYVPARQSPFSSMAAVVRADTGWGSILAASRAEVAALDKEIPVTFSRSMQEYVGASISQPRFNSMLLSLFAGLALLLSAIGLYGVVACAVAQRGHEIGVRMALGASSVDVVKSVIAHGMTLTLIGVVLGAVGAFALTRLMYSLLFGISPMDAWTMSGVSVIFGCIALIACWIPARRAASVDPNIALRYE